MNLRAMQLESEQVEWVQAHEALSRLAKERAVADAVEGRWLLVALRSAVHVHLGFGSFSEYVERLFGYKPRSTQEKLRVAEALEELPAIAGALESGVLNWSSARELTRVAVAGTEREWLDAARGKTVHQVETLVAGKVAGDLPTSPNSPSAQRHVLRFEVAAETLALFREAMSQLRRCSGAPIDDDSALMLMARQVLGGPGDAGRASYQIALSVCPDCGEGRQRANGELLRVGAEVVAMAECDGQHLGLLEGPANESADESECVVANDGAHTGVPTEVKAGRRRRGSHVDAVKNTETIGRRPTIHAGADEETETSCRQETAHLGAAEDTDANGQRPSAHLGAVEDADSNSHRRSAYTGGVEDADGRGQRVTAHVGAVEEAGAAGWRPSAHVGASTTAEAGECRLSDHADVCTEAGANNHRRHAHSRPRARQTIAPAMRRAVLGRDQHRCTVPGCRNALFLDLHHIELSSEGGANEADNLVTLCGAHHRAAHRGELGIFGRVSTGVRFRHADGSEYGRVAAPVVAEIRTKAFAALRGLGFRERDVRRVLAELSPSGEEREAELESVLRCALSRLTFSGTSY